MSADDRWQHGLYGNGMHDWILDEALLGARVAHAQDSEDTGWSALLDRSYAEYCAETDLTLDLRQLPA